MALSLVAGLAVSTEHASAAVLPALPPSTQFDITGFLQVATLDQACVTAAGSTLDDHGFPQVAHCGGTMQLNGHTIVVPNETIAILPASALSWEELFAQAPAPYGPTQTGMALADVPKPLTTYEVQAIGNRVLDPTNPDPTKRDRYIAGLVHVSQQDLNAGAGYINFMDYSTGEMRVGGVLGDATTGARVRINDPANPTTVGGLTGRYGRAMSPDPRFMVDQDNPTIASATAYPMCFPRTDPAAADDPQCPLTNRPVDATGVFSMNFTMNDPANIPLGGAQDPRLQAPMEVGDFVWYAGTLVADNPVDPASPTYISAHTITDNAAIYTFAGTSPAYVGIEVGILGTGGLTVIGAGEAAVRSRWEGMTTDPTRGVHLYGVDVNPDGTMSDRDFGTVLPGDFASAVPGRWRFRPPCFTNGTTTQNDPKFRPAHGDCVYGPGDTFLPAVREVRAVIEGLQTQNPNGGSALTSANGIVYGQYHAPIGEYIFPENVPGAPIPENNFNTMPFLASGGYSSFTGVVGGQLNPWPSNVVPPVVCIAPVAHAGGPYTVGSGGTVTLAASNTGTNPVYAWTSPAPPLTDGTIAPLNSPTPTYTAPVTSTAKVVTLSLNVSNGCGTSNSTATVLVNGAVAPTVTAVPPQTVASGNTGTINLTGTDTNVPASTPLTFSVTQSGAPALTGFSVTPTGATTATVHYTAPAVTAPPKVITLTIVATNSAGAASLPVTTTVTINPAVVGVAPTANAGGPYTVNSGSTVTLGGSASGTAPLIYAWAALPPANGSLSSLSIPNPVFRAPVVAVDTTVNLSLTVTNSAGVSTATTTVLVKAALVPTVNPVTAISVFSGANGSFTVTGADPNTPALLPLTFKVATPTAPLTGVFVSNPSTSTSATVKFTAPLIPPGPNVVTTLSITSTNSFGLISLPRVVTITIKPSPDSPVITNAEYRIGQQRLILAATTTVIDPNVVLTLLPYPTATGGTFTPVVGANTMLNGGGGLYTMTLVGVPQPAAGAHLQISSNLGGISPLHALDRLRQ
jgi:hypothetical protein